MSKFKMFGVLSWVTSFILLLFQGISLVTKTNTEWENLALVDILEENAFTWIDGISWTMLQNGLNYLVTMPLFMLLICIGLICFIISAFFEG